MLLQDGEAASVLTGAVDETTDISHELLTRFGLYRRRPVSNLDLFTGRVKGTIAGEGAAFFLLAGQPSDHDYARLDGISTLYKPESIADIEQHIQSFLGAHAVDPDTIDVVITGHNGDSRSDDIYRQLALGSSPVSVLFRDRPVIPYKHLCGEYPTSTAFALWMAAQRIRSGAAGYSSIIIILAFTIPCSCFRPHKISLTMLLNDFFIIEDWQPGNGLARAILRINWRHRSLKGIFPAGRWCPAPVCYK